MKAFILEGDGIENLKLKELPNPVIGAGEVLIKTKAISMNPVDIATIKIAGVRGGLYVPTPGEDVIVGWDIAGVVESVGAEVTTLKAGDRVFGCIYFPGQGKAYADMVKAKPADIAIIPDNVTFEAAASAGMACLTPWLALVTRGKVSKGDKVLIHAAAGGVGHFAVQIAKHFGAYVIGTASTANVDFVKSIGADEVIDYKTTKFEDVVKDADLVLDSIDAANLLRSLDAVKPGGRVISLKAEFDGEIAEKAKSKNVTGIRVGVYSNGTDLIEIAKLLGSGAIKPVVSQTFKFADLPKAAGAMATILHGKLIISVE